jgi:hypothetical protein
MDRRRLPQITPGMRFGRLTVISRAKSDPRNPQWSCQCDCGNQTQSHTSSLRSGRSKSCGCLKKEFKDITGQRFGRLVALYRAGRNHSNRMTIWHCRCDCGRECEVRLGDLGTRTKSCGCLNRELIRERSYRHGEARPNNISPLYVCWNNIKKRCLNPKNAGFKNWGGRGITIAPEWIDDFQAFHDYVTQNLGPRPKGYTLDRIDNDGNYEPGNLRWAPRSQQNLNSRRSRVSKILNALLLECVKPQAR